MRENEEDFEGPIEIPVRDAGANSSWFVQLIIGNVVTLFTAVVVFAFGYGSVVKEQNTQQAEIQLLRARDITPGAQAAIGVIQAQDRALEMRVTNIESEMRSQRAELMAYLQRFESKLDAHTDGRR